MFFNFLYLYLNTCFCMFLAFPISVVVSLAEEERWAGCIHWWSQHFPEGYQHEELLSVPLQWCAHRHQEKKVRPVMLCSLCPHNIFHVFSLTVIFHSIIPQHCSCKKFHYHMALIPGLLTALELHITSLHSSWTSNGPFSQIGTESLNTSPCMFSWLLFRLICSFF